MAYSTIDVGEGATYNPAGTGPGYTFVEGGNAANASGIIDSFEIYPYENISGLKGGVASGSSTTYTIRAGYASLGNASAGAKRTFTGLSIPVTSGDFLAHFFSGGTNCHFSTGSGRYFYASDLFGAGSTLYNGQAVYHDAVYATGFTVPDAPTSVSATDNLTDKITVTWTAGTGETGGHRVYRDGADISGVVAHGTATYDDTGGTVGTTYAYTVKAINDAGLSAASTADNGTRVSGFQPYNCPNILNPILAQ